MLFNNKTMLVVLCYIQQRHKLAVLYTIPILDSL